MRPDDQFIDEHPIRSGMKKIPAESIVFALLSSGPPIPEEWDRESVYLQVLVEGFVGKYVSTQTTEDVISTLKAFCGLSLALRLLKVEHSYQPAGPKMNLIVHRNADEKWIIDETVALNEDFSETIRDLVFHDLDGTLDDDSKRRGWILRCVSKLRTVFANQEKAEKIILAGQWFLDSFSGKNELLSFVQTMVALEIILGDKASSDEVGIGELLRNRCAYLVGKNHKQREDILRDFKDIYGIRSRIVHRGKSRLTVKERILFHKLQWMCRRVIQEEIDLITESR